MKTHRALAAAIVLAARVVHAEPTPKECVLANERSIEQWDKHALHAAREQGLVCADPKCPTEVRLECERRLSSITSVMPSLVLLAKDDSGNDVVDVHVTMDGKPLVDKLDGAAIEIDPGSHELTFTAEGHPSISKNIVMAERDKRQEIVTFTRKRATPAVEQVETRDPTRRLIGLSVVGAGMTTIAMGALFSSLASTAWMNSRDACGTLGCPDRARALSEHDSAVSLATVATIMFIAGPVLLVGGGFLFFTAPVVSQKEVGFTLGGRF